MKRVMSRTLLATAVLGCGVAFAAEPTGRAQPTTAELQEQIRQLQAQMDQMKAERSANDAVLKSVQADADSRSQMLQATGLPKILAGMEKGKPMLQSDDGKFTLSPSLQVQVRNVTNYIDEDPTDPDGDESLENGFEIRRAKFGFNGKIAGDFGYKFVWATNREFTAGSGAGNVYLEDVAVNYKLNDNWTLVAGQFKDPVHHEELVSSTKQMAVDRSLVNEQLGGGATDRVQGAGVEYTQGPIWVTVIGHDGANSDNRNFRDTPVTNTDWGASARLEYTVFGDKKAYGDFSAMKNEESLLVIGVGGDVTGTATSNVYFYTVDAQFETATGLGLYGAALGRTIDPYGDGDETNDYGGLVQISQMLGDKWEIFGRYGVIDFDGADDVLNEITVGANYYMWGHGAKLTLDLVVLPDGAPADTGLGYLNSGDELQVVGRVQFQLAI
jgi:hypothetical protein